MPDAVRTCRAAQHEEQQAQVSLKHATEQLRDIQAAVEAAEARRAGLEIEHATLLAQSAALQAAIDSMATQQEEQERQQQEQERGQEQLQQERERTQGAQQQQAGGALDSDAGSAAARPAPLSASTDPACQPSVYSPVHPPRARTPYSLHSTAPDNLPASTRSGEDPASHTSAHRNRHSERQERPSALHALDLGTRWLVNNSEDPLSPVSVHALQSECAALRAQCAEQQQLLDALSAAAEAFNSHGEDAAHSADEAAPATAHAEGVAGSSEAAPSPHTRHPHAAQHSSPVSERRSAASALRQSVAGSVTALHTALGAEQLSAAALDLRARVEQLEACLQGCLGSRYAPTHGEPAAGAPGCRNTLSAAQHAALQRSFVLVHDALSTLHHGMPAATPNARDAGAECPSGAADTPDPSEGGPGGHLAAEHERQVLAEEAAYLQDAIWDAKCASLPAATTPSLIAA